MYHTLLHQLVIDRTTLMSLPMMCSGGSFSKQTRRALSQSFYLVESGRWFTLSHCVVANKAPHCTTECAPACCADGVSGLSGALAGLAQYYQNKQNKQNDCGLDLGWTHPGAHVWKRSINNTRTCG